MRMCIGSVRVSRVLPDIFRVSGFCKIHIFIFAISNYITTVYEEICKAIIYLYLRIDKEELVNL